MAGIHEGGFNITGFYGASFARFGGRAGWRLGFVWLLVSCLLLFCLGNGGLVGCSVRLFVVAFILFTCLFLEDSQGKLLD